MSTAVEAGKWPAHPVADLFPMMTDEELSDLAVAPVIGTITPGGGWKHRMDGGWERRAVSFPGRAAN
jgi:hypothetical protein